MNNFDPMNSISETSFPAVLDDFNNSTAAADFVQDQPTADPLSIFETIKDRLITIEDESPLLQ
jgi:hypothetical protein